MYPTVYQAFLINSIHKLRKGAYIHNMPSVPIKGAAMCRQGAYEEKKMFVS